MLPTKKRRSSIERAVRMFKQHGGILRTAEAMRSGIHPRDLHTMLQEGLIERLEWGLYRLESLGPLENPDLTQVSVKVPKAVICLISALSFHKLTTQVPHEVYIALKKGDERPRLKHPPIRPFWFTEPAYSAGIEIHKMDGVSVRIYSAEKTIADVFKFRNKLGLDVATEALRLYIRRKKTRIDNIERYATIDRVRNVIRPYLEALL